MTEFRPGRFQILPTIVKNLVIINVLVFAAEQLPLPGISLMDIFALHTFQSDLFKPWQLVTHMFMHADFLHILFNMFALWMFGSILENLWVPKRFLTFYLISGLGAALCHMIVLYYENGQLLQQFYSMSTSERQLYADAVRQTLNEPTIGASGAVFGCLAAFGYLFPNTYVYFYFFIPVKAKWFVLFYAGTELFAALRGSAGDNVAHFAHLGGALAGFLMVFFWNKTNRKTFY